jgi:hypothetical protein
MEDKILEELSKSTDAHLGQVEFSVVLDGKDVNVTVNTLTYYRSYRVCPYTVERRLKELPLERTLGQIVSALEMSHPQFN